MKGFTKPLKQLLKENGCYFHRQGKGDHEVWYSPISDTYFTVDNCIMSRHTANKALKDAGLKKAF